MSREIEVGSQVIVNESEEALLFENGQLIEILDAGRHVIESGNIPGMDGNHKVHCPTHLACTPQ